MDIQKAPQKALRSLMIDTFERSRNATQSYVDLFVRAMRGHSSADEAQVEFKAYIKRQVAANHAFVNQLARTKDFKEALRIQLEYFQSQLKAAAGHVKVVEPFRRSAGERR